MFIVFAIVDGVEQRFQLAAVSRNAAVQIVRRQHDGCTIVSVL
jgi:hypothetical protein